MAASDFRVDPEALELILAVAAAYGQADPARKARIRAWLDQALEMIAEAESASN